jgi:pseudouridine-5'-phosphate glycosidase
MQRPLEIRSEVRQALDEGRPVVALESTLIAHGLPRPRNLEVAIELEATVRAEGAVPATIGLLEGQSVVGLSREELGRLADGDDVAKVSSRDLGVVLAAGSPGATTVAGTLRVAALAGVRVMATGGIGGVHLDAEHTLDISSDLTELSRAAVTVVCAGAKSVLDLARTLEALETLGVPVIGYGVDEFPAFYSRESGLRLEHRIEAPDQAARLMEAHWELGGAGIVLANPPPGSHALPSAEVESWLAQAAAAARTEKVKGKAVTPYLLDRLAGISDGRTVETNVALLVDNAQLAARVAVSFANR